MIFPHSGRQLRPLSGLPRRLHQASTILGTITRLANLEARLRPTGERRVLRTRARVTLALSTSKKILELDAARQRRVDGPRSLMPGPWMTLLCAASISFSNRATSSAAGSAGGFATALTRRGAPRQPRLSGFTKKADDAAVTSG